MSAEWNAESRPDVAPPSKLLVSGLVQLGKDPALVELRRGMPIWTQGDHQVGLVAGVIEDCQTSKLTHIMLGNVPPTSTYHLVPLDLVDMCDGEAVWLGIDLADLDSLPVHQPD